MLLLEYFTDKTTFRSVRFFILKSADAEDTVIFLTALKESNSIKDFTPFLSSYSSPYFRVWLQHSDTYPSKSIDKSIELNPHKRMLVTAEEHDITSIELLKKFVNTSPYTSGYVLPIIGNWYGPVLTYQDSIRDNYQLSHILCVFLEDRVDDAID